MHQNRHNIQSAKSAQHPISQIGNRIPPRNGDPATKTGTTSTPPAHGCATECAYE
jgi:hypothetical protein